jgi:cation diffusion facilitator CzcD-associated flavoprotein CzcO
VAAKLKVFMRSPTWISPALGSNPGLQFQNEHDSQHNSKHDQFSFTEAEKEEFRQNPQAHLRFRQRIEAEFNLLIDMFIVGSDVQKNMHKIMVESMKGRIGEGHDVLKEKLIPSWAPGCRRITPGDGYLETLVQPNVECIFGEIDHLTETQIVVKGGEIHDLDVLVRARHP